MKRRAGACAGPRAKGGKKGKVLVLASVASMIDQFNLPNIRLLLGMGYEVQVACNFREGNTCDQKRLRELKKELDAMRVVWRQWDCPRGVASFRSCYRAWRQLCGLLRQEDFSWLHCHSPVGGALARLAARRYGVRVVYTAHGFHFYQGAPLKNWLLYYPAEKFLAAWTDVLLTVNREDYRLARRSLRAGKVCYIPGVGVDPEKFLQPDLRRPGLGDADFCEAFAIPREAAVLLSVGELTERKNHRMAVDALAALDRTDVYYVVCGQGSLQKELLRYAKRRGVGDRVRLVGYQERMAWVLRNADIFVFPSLQEGLPVALLEAMAAGLACVVSDIRGNRELVRAAERFAPGDTQGLAALLERLLSDNRYRMTCGERNRRRVRKYSRSRVEARMKKIYAWMDSDVLDVLDGLDGKNRPAGTGRAAEGFSDRESGREAEGVSDRESGREAEGFSGREAEGVSDRESGREAEGVSDRESGREAEGVSDRESGREAADSPRVSVIMAVYQMGENVDILEQAVGSILKQTLSDWELLLYDDGSADRTLEELQRLARGDDRIRVLHGAANRKAGYARNRCMLAAKGRYLAIMDADDISVPDRLRLQADFLDAHPEYAFVGGSAWMFDGRGVWGLRSVEETPGKESFLNTLPFIHPSMMLRKEAALALHGYREGPRSYRVEDYEFLLRLYAAGYRGYNLQKPLLYYREDAYAYRRRKYRFRVAECRMRLQGFERLGILRGNLRYVMKPLAAGAVPAFLMRAVRARRYRIPKTGRTAEGRRFPYG